MSAFLTELMTSKKVVAAFSAVVTVIAVKVAGKAGIMLDAESANQITMLVGVITSAYLVSQGIADVNKSAVKLALDVGVDPAGLKVVKVIAGNITNEPAKQ